MRVSHFSTPLSDLSLSALSLFDHSQHLVISCDAKMMECFCFLPRITYPADTKNKRVRMNDERLIPVFSVFVKSYGFNVKLGSVQSLWNCQDDPPRKIWLAHLISFKEHQISSFVFDSSILLRLILHEEQIVCRMLYLTGIVRCLGTRN